jgi:coenzyme F420-dependent glucose-6-phosphate dehydrogenase
MKLNPNNSNPNPNQLPSIGYWAAQEQYPMKDLIKFATEAEKNGFTSTMTSDHFHPWWHDNAFGNFTWVWIAAAAAQTKRMRFATGVTSPVFRYHPAIIAQAFASLDVLYPGRIDLGVGTGESMNESPLGFSWPSPTVRLKRTVEAIQIIKKLWYPYKQQQQQNEGFIDFNGEFFLISQAKLYTPPSSEHINIYMAAAGPESTKAAAKYTDGIITFFKPDQSKEIVKTFNSAAKKEGRESQLLHKIAEYKLSYSEDYDKGFESANFWRATLLKDAFSTYISDPRKLEAKAKQQVPDEKLNENIDIITSIEDSIKSIEQYFNAGYTQVYAHSTSPDELLFIREFGKKVLPYFNGGNTANPGQK